MIINTIKNKKILKKTCVYSVLQMGKFNPNYEIDSLLKICEILEINIKNICV